MIERNWRIANKGKNAKDVCILYIVRAKYALMAYAIHCGLFMKYEEATK